jgi:DNA-binding GntR family transcriptional regulator
VLADEIVRGIIGPGVSLDEATIAERFEVSRTPVREAIRQLEAIGFAEARPHRGAVVPNFTTEKLNEIFLVMAELEALCASLASTAATETEKAELQRSHTACSDAAKKGDVALYYELNIKFHETIYTLSHNGFLMEVTLGVRNRVAPFRRAQFESMGRLLRSVAEHQAVVEAILAGNADLAGAAMRQHLGYVRTSVDDVTHAHEAASSIGQR